MPNRQPLLTYCACVQVVLALLDLELHSADAMPPEASTARLRTLRSRHSLLPDEPGTWPHAAFGHLASYGAGYYSYLWARSLSHRVWRQCFESNPLNADAGRRWCHTVLRHGGAREPLDMLREMMAGTSLTAIPHSMPDPILELVPTKPAQL